MWRDYFGEAARIIGIDLSIEARKLEDYGFEIFIGDQANPEFWTDFFQTVGMVDVVLDDGGHTNLQQITTLNSTIPNIRDGGLLIVEDTVSSYMQDFGNPSSKSFISKTKLLIDQLHSDSHLLSSKEKGLGKLVWSISYFNSIVAFRVDRAKASIPANSIVNSGIAPEVIDMRFSNISATAKLISGFLQFLNRIQNRLESISPFLGWIFRGLTSIPRGFLGELYKLSKRNH